MKSMYILNQDKKGEAKMKSDFKNTQTFHKIKENITKHNHNNYIELNYLVDRLYDNNIYDRRILKREMEALNISYKEKSDYIVLEEYLFTSHTDFNFENESRSEFDFALSSTVFYFYMKEKGYKKLEKVDKNNLKETLKVLSTIVLEIIYPDTDEKDQGIYYSKDETEILVIDSIAPYIEYLSKLSTREKKSQVYPIYDDSHFDCNHPCQDFAPNQMKSDFYVGSPSIKTSIFFRGVSNSRFVCDPSIFRKPHLLSNERNFTQDIIINNADDFKNRNSIFEKLVYLQHFETPTRLVDLTQNPLAALYFSCEDKFNPVNNSTAGKVELYFENNNHLKYYDSDVIKVLSNLSRLTREEYQNLQSQLSCCRSCAKFGENCSTFNKNCYVKKLTSLIKNERPSFEPRIRPSDLLCDYIVYPVKDNQRIIAQSGLFMLCGVTSNIDKEVSYRTRYDLQEINGKKIVIYIPAAQKKKIISELETYNINLFSIYPDIQNASIHFQKKYINI
jgi:hypothetical protein